MIKIKTSNVKTNVALIGSFYAHAAHCAILDGSKLTVLMDDQAVLFDIETMSILRHRSIGDETYFSIYPLSSGYLVHGELSIVRLNSRFEQVWTFSGSDIWVTQNENHEEFRIENDQILLEDWNGVRYALNTNGKLLWNTQ
ncbi:hypothetical protein M3N64_08270 [Sporolactobacillus sp. CPB3-1]|uniref:Bulb-type lectin domain-containing protein n=1 Tax=Sporolactobacillus mangiferae TaxID=2940498 RepID=A0ABT0MB84_9BACL|nr:hypothetical protein [Sporolactobacillus mangiferae]MCL1631943.1 hypothetical protein [Sporolactobacillus mangiferae]